MSFDIIVALASLVLAIAVILLGLRVQRLERALEEHVKAPR